MLRTDENKPQTLEVKEDHLHAPLHTQSIYLNLKDGAPELSKIAKTLGSHMAITRAMELSIPSADMGEILLNFPETPKLKKLKTDSPIKLGEQELKAPDNSTLNVVPYHGESGDKDKQLKEQNLIGVSTDTWEQEKKDQAVRSGDGSESRILTGDRNVDPIKKNKKGEYEWEDVSSLKRMSKKGMTSFVMSLQVVGKTRGATDDKGVSFLSTYNNQAGKTGEKVDDARTFMMELETDKTGQLIADINPEDLKKIPINQLIKAVSYERKENTFLKDHPDLEFITHETAIFQSTKQSQQGFKEYRKAEDVYLVSYVDPITKAVVQVLDPETHAILPATTAKSHSVLKQLMVILESPDFKKEWDLQLNLGVYADATHAKQFSDKVLAKLKEEKETVVSHFTKAIRDWAITQEFKDYNATLKKPKKALIKENDVEIVNKEIVDELITSITTADKDLFSCFIKFFNAECYGGYSLPEGMEGLDKHGVYRHEADGSVADISKVVAQESLPALVIDPDELRTKTKEELTRDLLARMKGDEVLLVISKKPQDPKLVKAVCFLSTESHVISDVIWFNLAKDEAAPKDPNLLAEWIKDQVIKQNHKEQEVMVRYDNQIYYVHKQLGEIRHIPAENPNYEPAHIEQYKALIKKFDNAKGPVKTDVKKDKLDVLAINGVYIKGSTDLEYPDLIKDKLVGEKVNTTTVIRAATVQGTLFNKPKETVAPAVTEAVKQQTEKTSAPTKTDEQPQDSKSRMHIPAGVIAVVGVAAAGLSMKRR